MDEGRRKIQVCQHIASSVGLYQRNYKVYILQQVFTNRSKNEKIMKKRIKKEVFNEYFCEIFSFVPPSFLQYEHTNIVLFVIYD